MNKCIFTAQIVTSPKIFYLDKIALLQMILVIPNNKKGLSSYTLSSIVKGELAKDLFNTYQKNDFIIVEGFISIKKYQVKYNHLKKFNDRIKFLRIKINQIHPTSLKIK
uniref:Putative single-stranded DNA binding protein n=1 Tax=Plocamium cartilagineum TaxID=31452 RepID=A0A1C9CHQ0_PLOCA|nr:putative single-stranded DNA binding protein [Plocamium cartilagineum]AOM67887.1 putative single-stranded DNA binding protein [Plocamium cartilagineum]